MDRFDGYRAPIHQGLNAPRLAAGLPRDVFAIWWGLIATLFLNYTGIWWLWVGVGIGLHIPMAWATAKNPLWFQQARRALRQRRFLRSSGKPDGR